MIDTFDRGGTSEETAMTRPTEGARVEGKGKVGCRAMIGCGRRNDRIPLVEQGHSRDLI